jgi:hypothetical protein
MMHALWAIVKSSTLLYLGNRVSFGVEPYSKSAPTTITPSKQTHWTRIDLLLSGMYTTGEEGGEIDGGTGREGGGKGGNPQRYSM